MANETVISTSEREPLLERLGLPCYECCRSSAVEELGLISCGEFMGCQRMKEWYEEVWLQVPPETIDK